MIGDQVAAVPNGPLGGGRVLRPFSGRKRMDILTEEEVNAIPPKNLRALVQTGGLHVWPKPAEVEKAANTELHIATSGFGTFDVIEGVKIASRVDADEVFRLTGRAVGSVKARIEEEEKKKAAAAD